MLSKLTPLYIHLIGFFTGLIVFGALFYFVIKPRQENLEKTREETKSQQTTSHGDEKEKREGDLNNALRDEDTIKAGWQTVSAEYMPDLRGTLGTDVLQSYQNVADLPRQWGTWITSWYDVQRPLGIAREQGVEFPIPPLITSPNEISALRNITFPSPGKPWQVAVEAKSFDDLMRHFRRFNTEIKGRGMPVVNNISLEGQSPHLVARYDLALYIILGSEPPKMDATIGGGTTGTTTGGNRGGGMSSSMGMMGPGPMGGGGAPRAAGVSSGGGGSSRGKRGMDE